MPNIYNLYKTMLLCCAMKAWLYTLSWVSIEQPDELFWHVLLTNLAGEQ